MKAIELYDLIEELFQQKKIDLDTEIGMIIGDTDSPIKFQYKKVVTIESTESKQQIIILKMIGKYEL